MKSSRTDGLTNPSSPPVHMPDPDALMSFKQGCEFLGIGRRLGWSLCNQGKLPHLRVGRLIKFRRSALMDWAAEQEQKESR